MFISYRAVDGKEIANHLYDRLSAAGLNPWLDEAREGDRANLFPGADVQAKIVKHVRKASIVLLVDTPRVTESWWIKQEMDTAIGQMIPVLPVVVGPDRTSPRFASLQGLRRCAVAKPGGVDGSGLSDPEWQNVGDELEQVVARAYRSRQNIEFRARATFKKAEYEDWTVLDLLRRMYLSAKAQRGLGGGGRTVVLSHCLIQDIGHLAALRALDRYLRTELPDPHRVNYRLCVYDGDRVLSDPDVADIEQLLGELPFIPVHTSELEVLVESQYTRRRP